jgi:Fe-S cluster biogenesis protein NfuA
MPWDDEQAREQVAHVEELLSALGTDVDTGVRAVEALVSLYGECLARVMERLDEDVAETLATDELVRHLLLVHDLHPVDIETRVRQALEGLRLSSAKVRLLGVSDGVVRVRLEVQGCQSTAATLRTAIEQAVAQAAPDTDRVEVEEAAPESAGVIPVDALFSGGRVPGPG